MTLFRDERMAPPPEPWTWRDRLVLLALSGLGVLMLAGAVGLVYSLSVILAGAPS